jgi:hypothetical protein
VIRFLSDIKPANLLAVASVLIFFRLYFIFNWGEGIMYQEMGESRVDYLFFLLNRNQVASFIFSAILSFVTALVLNSIVNEQEMLPRKSYLPAYFYCIFSSFFPQYILLSPVVFINLLMAFAFQRIFEMYKATWPIDNIFLSGILVGICALFSYSYTVFFPYLIIGILFFRAPKLYEMLAALFGFLLPLFLGAILNYLFNSIFLAQGLKIPNYSLISSLDFMLKSPILLAIILVALATIKIAGTFWRNNIKNRRIILLLYFYTLVAILLALTGKQDPITESMFLAIPFALFASYYFSFENKLQLYKKIIHWTLFCSILIYQYKFLWIDIFK